MFVSNIIGLGILSVVIVMSDVTSLSLGNQPKAERNTLAKSHKTAGFNSFENIAEFLHELIKTLSTDEHKIYNEPLVEDAARNKRRAEGRQGSNVKHNYTFEDYERFYLADRILTSVKQTYFRIINKPNTNLTASLQANGTMSPHTVSTVTPSANSSAPGLSTTTESSRTDRKLEDIIAQLRNATVEQLQEALEGVEEAAKNALEELGISSLCCPLG